MLKLVSVNLIFVLTVSHCFPPPVEDLKDKSIRRGNVVLLENRRLDSGEDQLKNKNKRDMSNPKGLKYISPLSVPKTLKVGSSMVHQECQVFAFMDEITQEGCLPQSVPNNACFGRCTSVTFPFNDQLLQRCETCLPHKVEVKEVELHCPGRRTQKSQKVSFYYIKECKCRKVKCKK